MAKKTAKVKKRSRNKEPYATFRRATHDGGEPSCWNLYTDGVSSSMLNDFLTCREQLRLSAVKGYKPKSTPLPFAFGTCVHWILEQVYSRETKPLDHSGVKKYIAEFEELWYKEMPAPTQKALDTQQYVYTLAEAVLPTYFVRWRGDFPRYKYPAPCEAPTPRKWLGLETKYRVEYEFPDKTIVPVVGTRDGFFESKDGKRWMFDTKCRSVIDEDATLDTLPFDLQQMLYLWATRKQTGVCPNGTVMNIVRRPQHRQLKGESLKDFGERVAEDVQKESRWDHFFKRVWMELLPSEIDEWEHTQLAPLLRDVRDWYDGAGPHYMNPNALITKYGRCQMYSLIVNDDPTGYVQRKPGTVLSYQTDIV